MSVSAKRRVRNTRGTACETCARFHVFRNPLLKASTKAQGRNRMLHLPILRWGKPYRSVNQVVTPHFRTREPFVSMSQANLGLIRRDLLRQGEARAALQKIPAADLIAMAGR